MTDSNVIQALQTTAWQAVVWTLLIVVVVNVGSTIYMAVYNLYFHPLRKYKGPTLWIAFPMTKTLAMIRGQADYKLREYHERYGPVVRSAPNVLTFTTAGAWKDIYGHGHAELPKHFPPGFRKGEGGRPYDIITSDARDHFRFRRAMLPAFSNKALDLQEPLIQVYVDLLVERLAELAAKGESADMVKWYTYTTFDLIGDLAYGESFDGLKAGKQNAWVHSIEKLLQLFPIIILMTSSPLLGRLIVYLAGDAIKNSQRDHTKMVEELAMKRINNTTQKDRGDFMDFIMRSRGQEHGLSDAELVANSDTLIIAGSDTTASLLCAVTYWLLATPAALEKCVAEVRSAFDNGKEISFQAASSKLSYMLACLDEALRIMPPLPTATLRTTLPGQLTTVDGLEIPPNTEVGVHHISSYHSSANFYKAKEFHPERWLAPAREDPESPFYNDNREVHKPFSVGPRDCIGRNLAYHEMRLIMAKVLWNFDLSLTEEAKGWAERQRSFALWEKTPLMVKVRARKS